MLQTILSYPQTPGGAPRRRHNPAVVYLQRRVVEHGRLIHSCRDDTIRTARLVALSQQTCIESQAGVLGVTVKAGAEMLYGYGRGLILSLPLKVALPGGGG